MTVPVSASGGPISDERLDALIDALVEGAVYTPATRIALGEVINEVTRLRALLSKQEEALILVRDWIREGKGSEAEAAEAMDAALEGTQE